jgi:hypothetical protein
MVFVALMAFWLLYPVLEQGQYAQDAIPLVVAGELAHEHPDIIYVRPGGGLFDTQPEFFAASCKYYDNPADCESYVVAFVSPPPALPLVVPLSKLGDNAFLLVRELAAVALVAAMVVLWRRLTPLAPTSAWSLAISAALLTPLMTAPIGLGQSSPLLFLAAALPLTAMSRPGWRAVAFGALMALVGALKAFPYALLAIPVVKRRWRGVAWAAGFLAVLAAVALFIAPLDLWRTFVSRSGGLEKESSHNPYNSSLEAALGQIGIHATVIVWLVRVALAAPIVAVARRVRDTDVWWACSWAVMLVLFPQVWGHYSFVMLAAMAAVLVWRPDRERWLWALPVIAALTIPIGVLGGNGTGSPIGQLACNLAALVLIAVIATRPAAPAPSIEPSSSMV